MTVCPLLAVTVAVAIVTTVWPAGMVLTSEGWLTRVDAGESEVISESTKRRLRAVPVGGEL